MKKKIIVISFILIGTLIYFFMQKKDTFFYNGSVEAQESEVSSRVSGIVKKYYADEGSIVKKGDIIAELDSPDIEIAYKLSLSNYQRGQKLVNVNSITKEAFDILKYKYEEASLKLQWTKIYAPIDGQIIHKFRNEGELVMPGSKIVSINNTSIVYVNIYVAYNVLAKVKIGDFVKGFLPELKNKEFEGKIVFINDKAEFTPKNVLTQDERERLVYRLKIEFPNEELILKSGMTLEVKVPQIDNNGK
jgi:HlyD family secretion protein